MVDPSLALLLSVRAFPRSVVKNESVEKEREGGLGEAGGKLTRAVNVVEEVRDAQPWHDVKIELAYKTTLRQFELEVGHDIEMRVDCEGGEGARALER